ncbi:MAG: dTDP-4-dehydrorhamnose 3,5-epimerase family protein [Candidatus Scalindua sp.]|jgi:dTDP-4-dehydrorhamnose 3,5-epimerase|nr:dTDP-4-dehydrorhamnose 3,5-epimerase family protein [Candidatus Scalindua sp.]
MINGVKITTRKIIPDDRGKIMHIMKSSDSIFTTFGEVYCSTVYPGVVKGWHMHKFMTLNYVVLRGNIKFVLYDDRSDSETYKQIQEIIIGENQYVMVTVPPYVWNGFKGIGTEESFVINLSDIPHDKEEILRMDPHQNDIIDYNWTNKDR